ncbi:kelch-like protein 35 [Pteronotus mesoamericanus]|uniref:kelch-like protein 35 n=1 Tax=Pteronotus mesoamericanus TaxID=1884717 RepID=UPI0023EE22A8|nr:kelch-like protein 35 [Pteronotus parnellii mesoamericanus]
MLSSSMKDEAPHRPHGRQALGPAEPEQQSRQSGRDTGAQAARGSGGRTGECGPGKSSRARAAAAGHLGEDAARWIFQRYLCSLPSRMLEGPLLEESEPGAEAPCTGSCHAQRVLQTLNAYRRSGTLTDVVLRAGGRDFPCHRAALSAGSAYFRSLFAAWRPERGLAVVPVVPVVPQPGRTGAASALAVVLDYVYGAGVRLRAEDEAAAVLELAQRLGVAGLREACARFLEGRLRAANSLALRRVAAAFSLPSLAERCSLVLRQAFTEVVRHADFLELAPDEVAALLADPALGVAREEAVFEAAMRWVRHDAPARRGQLRRLLEHVRLPLLAPDYFLEKVEADELLQACGECRPLLLEARACFILGREASALRARPRRFMDLAEVIVVIGGCDRKGLLKLPFADAYHPESQRWTPLPSLPGYMRSEFAACTLRNDIYVSGGHINSHDVWMFNSHLHTWIKVASLHKGRWRHKMAVLQGQLFAVGGFDGLQRLHSVERYDPFSNTWAAAAPLPEAVSSAAVVASAGRLYVIGGAGQDGINTDKVQCFDPKEDQWSLRSPAPFSQRCLEAVSLEDTIYVVGGLMSKIFTYTPGTDVWGEAAVLPSPVENCGVTVCDGKVHILGGRDDHGESTNRVFTFDPSSGQVEAQPSLLRCTSSHGCVTIVQSLGR